MLEKCLNHDAKITIAFMGYVAGEMAPKTISGQIVNIDENYVQIESGKKRLFVRKEYIIAVEID